MSPRELRSPKWVSALAACAVAGTAWGFAPPTTEKSSFIAYPIEIGHQVVRPDSVSADKLGFKAKSLSLDAKVRYDRISGEPRVVRGNLGGDQKITGLDLAAFDEAARAYFASQKDLGLEDIELVLSSEATLFNAEEQMLKYKVLRDGVEIQDANVDAHFKYGKLVQVINQSFTEAKWQNNPKAKLSGLDMRVANFMHAESIKSLGIAARVRLDNGGYWLMAVEEFEVVNEHDRFIVQVDAATGKPYEIRPTTYYLGGSAEGHVHNRWYDEELELRPYGELTLTYAGGSVTTDTNGEFFDISDAAEPQLTGFNGPRVRVSLRTGSEVAATGSLIRDGWRVIYRKTGAEDPAADKNIAQSMIFYHTNAIIQEGMQYIDPTWFDNTLTANANLSQTCNAHWDGRTINFYSAGSGCANTANISDVVYHEWGHGLDANTGGIADGAFSEGFGDIMSLVMTKSHILGIGFRIGGDPVRDLEPNKVYPDDQGGGVHAEGLIIGSTFWDLYNGLVAANGEDAADALIKEYAFKMIYPATRYTDVYDALLVIDDDDADTSNGTPNYCVINKHFSDHGLAEVDDACSLAVIDEFKVGDTSGNGNGVVEPGETIEVKMLARNAAPSVLSGLSGEISIDAEDITVVDADLSWDDIAGGDFAVSRDAASFTLGENVACGSTFAMTVRLSADSRIATSSRTFSVGRLDGQIETASATDLPVDIIDMETVTSEVAFNSSQWDGNAGVQSARLRFNITHTYVGDLDVVLRSPSGAAFAVYSGSGSADNVTFDEDVTELLAGEPGSGTWTLEVSDTARQDVGTLDSFSLELTPAKFVCE